LEPSQQEEEERESEREREREKAAGLLSLHQPLVAAEKGSKQP
jgi:hypothetical protein